MITVDVPARSLHLNVSDTEIADRLTEWKSAREMPQSGYERLYHIHVQGADTGADFDFLRGMRGSAVGKDSH
jgi:dihydroxy-acid dehydratase